MLDAFFYCCVECLGAGIMGASGFITYCNSIPLSILRAGRMWVEDKGDQVALEAPEIS